MMNDESTAFSQEERELIQKRLEEKKATRACASCGKKDFTLLATAHIVELLHEPGCKPNGSRKVVPLVGMYCDHCGWVSYHVPKALGRDVDSMVSAIASKTLSRGIE